MLRCVRYLLGATHFSNCTWHANRTRTTWGLSWFSSSNVHCDEDNKTTQTESDGVGNSSQKREEYFINCGSDGHNLVPLTHMHTTQRYYGIKTLAKVEHFIIHFLLSFPFFKKGKTKLFFFSFSERQSNSPSRRHLATTEEILKKEKTRKFNGLTLPQLLKLIRNSVWKWFLGRDDFHNEETTKRLFSGRPTFLFFFFITRL